MQPLYFPRTLSRPAAHAHAAFPWVRALRLAGMIAILLVPVVLMAWHNAQVTATTDEGQRLIHQSDRDRAVIQRGLDAMDAARGDR